MKALNRILWTVSLLAAACTAVAAEVELEGNRLLVSGVLDGSALKEFTDSLATGKVRTVVFANSMGGTADVAEAYATAIRSSGVQTEVIGQCHAACAYAFLAGKDHRFGRGFQINGLLIPVAVRPARSADLMDRWRGDEAQKQLAEFTTGGASPTAMPAAQPQQRDGWQADHGVLFTSTPTLFGRVYNTFFCDGTQGRDLSKCELLTDADPYKLGVLTP